MSGSDRRASPVLRASRLLWSGLCAFSLVWAGGASAHEFWLLPDRFDPVPGQRVAVALQVGQGWPGEPVQRNPPRIVRFDVVDARRRVVPLTGTPGAHPAGAASIAAPGVAIAVYRSRPTPITLEPALFESYLREEGLEHVIEARQANATAAEPAREIYSRCAKALLHVGGARGPSAGHDRAVGLALELLPLTDPTTLRNGGALTVRLLWQGRPLAGALVRALPQNGRAAPGVRTGADGSATVSLAHGGVWLLNAVHMEPAPPDSGAEWESTWSSLVLQLPG